jgi:hypothetical protein
VLDRGEFQNQIILCLATPHRARSRAAGHKSVPPAIWLKAIFFSFFSYEKEKDNLILCYNILINIGTAKWA